MDMETFLQNLGLPVNSDIDSVERAFVEALKERLQTVAENYDETELREEEQWLRSFLRQYFDFTMQWVAKQAERFQDVKEFDTAPKLKKQAKAVIADLQNYIAEFVSCYMHLNRFMTLLRDEIKNEEIRMVGGGGAQKTRWTADAGVLIARYRKEKKALVERTERMGEARKLLEQIENDFDQLRAATINLFGKDKAEPYLRKFNAGLRMTDFHKAHKAIKDIEEAKKKFGMDQKTIKQNLDVIIASGKKIIDTTEQSQKLLASIEENKIFLKPIETDLAYNADIRELQKIKAFLAKYHLPYMQYKLDTLGHLKDKLLVMNTLESLMTLYKRMIAGIAVPLQDIKTVRLYESEILNHVQYLLTGHRPRKQSPSSARAVRSWMNLRV